MHHKRCAAVSSPVTCSCNSMLKLSTRLLQQLTRQRAVLSVRTSFLRAFVLVLGLFFRGSGPLDLKLLGTLRHFFYHPEVNTALFFFFNADALLISFSRFTATCRRNRDRKRLKTTTVDLASC